MNKRTSVAVNVVMDSKMPITSHINELRRSLAIVIAALLLGSGLAYSSFQPILKIFQAPLGEKLFYTSPTGGFSFVIKLCLAVGVIVAIPVIINRIFSFAKPVIPKAMQRAFAWYSLISVCLALLGVIFAYVFSLPSALHFLTNFNKEQIQSLITVDSYFTFVITYLIGYALLFQTPIIMLFINRIKPLKPGSMLGAERYVILGSFVVAAILTPTPDPWNQLLMALPIILLYQFGVIAIWLTNRNKVIIYNHVPVERLKAKIPAHLTKMSPKTQAPRATLVPVATIAPNVAVPSAPILIEETLLQPRVFDIIAAPRTT